LRKEGVLTEVDVTWKGVRIVLETFENFSMLQKTNRVNKKEESCNNMKS
jgi:hypothetical protein